MRSGNRYTGSLERADGPANTRMEPTLIGPLARAAGRGSFATVMPTGINTGDAD
jgi:hypothetical protein